MRLYSGTLPARVVDILETVGESLTLARLEAEYESRFGTVNEATLKHVCSRLRKRGVLESKLVEHPDDEMPNVSYRFVSFPVATDRCNGGRLGVADMTHDVFWGRVEAQQAEYHAGRMA